MSQVDSLTGLEDLSPGAVPFHAAIGEFVYFAASFWKTNRPTSVRLFNPTLGAAAEHVVPTAFKLIMLDDTGIAAKAVLLIPLATEGLDLPVGMHLISLDFTDIEPVKPVQVILRPGTEKISLRFERAHCNLAQWEVMQLFIFPP